MHFFSVIKQKLLQLESWPSTVYHLAREVELAIINPKCTEYSVGFFKLFNVLTYHFFDEFGIQVVTIISHRFEILLFFKID